MSRQMNNILPFELLKYVFQNLIENNQGKKDLKTCSTVCKSWKVPAQEVFGNISIVVSEESLERLLRDIVYFAQKVKSFTLEESKSADIDRGAASLAWFNIILTCPNLVSININVNDDSEYAEDLMYIATEKLGHIRSFETPNSNRHLQFNVKCCQSITSLSITSPHHFDGDRRDHMLLIDLISSFPKLTSFSLKRPYIEYAVDIIQFLEAAPQLQELFICFFFEVKSSISRPISNDSCLSVLSLKVEKMDIYSLIFITSGLKKLNQLTLRIIHLMTGESQKILGRRKGYSAEELLNDLQEYTLGISEFFIRYTYENITYILMNDKEPQICSNENYNVYYYDDDNNYEGL